MKASLQRAITIARELRAVGGLGEKARRRELATVWTDQIFCSAFAGHAILGRLSHHGSVTGLALLFENEQQKSTTRTILYG